MSDRDEAIKKIKELEDKYSDDGYIFRGTTEQFSKKEGEGKIRDGINSTLYRSLAKRSLSKGREDFKKIFTKNKEIFLDVMEEEKISGSMNKHDTLTFIQHFGGKTNNIDFSRSIHIALFFACQEESSASGELIILHRDKDKLSLEKEGIKITDAANTQDSRYRVSFQQSVFARSAVGYIAPELCKIEEIDKELKKPILEYLWEEKKINRNTVYGDWDGFVKDQESIESATPYFEEGLAYQNKGEHKKAIACYDKGLKINPNVPAAYNNRGNSYMALGEYERAIEDINKAISFNLNDADAHNGRGVAYKHLNQLNRAIEDFSRAIELKPDYITPYYNRGNAYNALGQYNLAIKDYDEAISLNPDYAPAHNNRAASYSHLGDHKRALEGFDQSILLEPKNHEAFFNRGCAYDALKQHEQAIKDYGKAISLKPNYANAYNNRASSYHALGQLKQAIKDYGKAISINPNFAEAYCNRGVIYGIMGKNDLAIKDYDKTISLNPNHTKAYYNRAAEKYEKGDMKGAMNDFFKSIRRGLIPLTQKESLQILPMFWYSKRKHDET